MCKNKASSGSLKIVIDKMFTNHIYLIYMYKEDLTLNNLQWLMCHKTQTIRTVYILPLNVT